MQFEYLADYPDSVPQIISWWHTIWADRMGSDLAALEQQLLAALGKDHYTSYYRDEGRPARWNCRAETAGTRRVIPG